LVACQGENVKGLGKLTRERGSMKGNRLNLIFVSRRLNYKAVNNSVLDKELRRFLTYYKESFGYYDLLLISVEGDIIFSEKLEDDFGTNVKTGLL
jgi:hypothetical protein